MNIKQVAMLRTRTNVYIIFISLGQMILSISGCGLTGSLFLLDWNYSGIRPVAGLLLEPDTDLVVL